MSDVESYDGRLIPVDLGGKSLEGFAESFYKVRDSNVVLEDYYSSWLEKFEDDNYRDYFVDHKRGFVYEMVLDVFDNESFIRLSKNVDGSYSFVTSFYDGGVSLSEMVSEGFDDLFLSGDGSVGE